MYTCNWCGKLTDGGYGNFCSRKCSAESYDRDQYERPIIERQKAQQKLENQKRLEKEERERVFTRLAVETLEKNEAYELEISVVEHRRRRRLQKIPKKIYFHIIPSFGIVLLYALFVSPSIYALALIPLHLIVYFLTRYTAIGCLGCFVCLFLPLPMIMLTTDHVWLMYLVWIQLFLAWVWAMNDRDEFQRNYR